MQVLHDRAGGEDVDCAVADRQPLRRSIGDNPALDRTVAPELFFGAIEGDDQLFLRICDERQKRAILAAADIEHDLPRPAVYQRSDFVLIDCVEVALEGGRQQHLDGHAEAPVGGDEAGEQGHERRGDPERRGIVALTSLAHNDRLGDAVNRHAGN